MDLLLTAEQDSWVHTLHNVNTNIWTGIMAVAQAMYDHYWQHWTQFLSRNFNLYLQNLVESQ